MRSVFGLLQNLGNFGPLKCREFYALDKLQKQAKILENLMKIARVGSEVDLHPGEKSGLFQLHTALSWDVTIPLNQTLKKYHLNYFF